MPSSLQIAFVNNTNSSSVYAYITGLALQNNSALFLLQADGQTPYYPTSPSSDQQPLQANCAIALGAPGNTRTVTIPQIAGGRIWFSINAPLTFLLNRGPALVEPSVTNPSDPNIAGTWGFCEFTLNADQLFANISYVDFVSIPIALTLESNTPNTPVQHVSGMPPTGLDTICAGLRAQAAKDGQPWDKLIVPSPSGGNLRALSPNHGMVMNGSLFANYYDPYVRAVWQKYASQTLRINPQTGQGVLSGGVSGNELTFEKQQFNAPSTSDIFSCSTGPFQTGSDGVRNAIIPRLAAAFVRSTLLTQPNQPADPSTFYKTDPTNHYARIVHAANLDGKGYAFPYDDVQPDGGSDQSGKVNDGNPKLFTVAVGGNNAYTGDRRPVAGHEELKRDAAPAPAPGPAGAAEPQNGRKRSFLQRLLGRK